MSRYDVVVIGSGMGGLTCAAMLAKEGMKVCVVEKNHRPGAVCSRSAAAGASSTRASTTWGACARGRPCISI